MGPVSSYPRNCAAGGTPAARTCAAIRSFSSKKDDPISHEEIEAWFNSDPAAPVILYSMPPLGPSDEDLPRIVISVNQHAVDRELRARGIDERHPSWDLAQKAVGPTLRDTTRELLEELLFMAMDDDLLEDPPWDSVSDPKSGWISPVEG